MGFAFQYARAVRLTRAEDPRREYAYLALRWSRPIHRSLRLVLEPNVGAFRLPAGGAIAGLNVMLRYLPLPEGRLRPFASLGGGVLETGFPLLDSSFNFTLLGGAGADYFLTRSLALELEYRLHHISNGGLRRPNVGINAHLGSVGISYYY